MAVSGEMIDSSSNKWFIGQGNPLFSTNLTQSDSSFPNSIFSEDADLDEESMAILFPEFGSKFFSDFVAMDYDDIAKVIEHEDHDLLKQTGTPALGSPACTSNSSVSSPFSGGDPYDDKWSGIYEPSSLMDDNSDNGQEEPLFPQLCNLPLDDVYVPPMARVQPPASSILAYQPSARKPKIEGLSPRSSATDSPWPFIACQTPAEAPSTSFFVSTTPEATCKLKEEDIKRHPLQDHDYLTYGQMLSLINGKEQHPVLRPSPMILEEQLEVPRPFHLNVFEGFPDPEPSLPAAIEESDDDYDEDEDEEEEEEEDPVLPPRKRAKLSGPRAKMSAKKKDEHNKVEKERRAELANHSRGLRDIVPEDFYDRNDNGISRKANASKKAVYTGSIKCVGKFIGKMNRMELALNMPSDTITNNPFETSPNSLHISGLALFQRTKKSTRSRET